LKKEEPLSKLLRDKFVGPNLVYGAWTALLCGIVGLFALQGLYPSFIGPASNVLPTVCVGIAVASSLCSIRRYGLSIRNNFQRTWVLFALGTCIWTCAELIWAVYYFALNVPVPYPSVADVFYMGGYVPMLAGLLTYLQAFRKGMTRRRLVIATLVIVSAALAVVSLVIPPEMAMSEPLLQRFTDIGYPVLDLSLLSATVLSLAIFYGASLSRWLIAFAAAAIAYVVADELFLYMVAAGTYYNGSVDDLLFLVGYLLFALAFYEHRRRF